MAEMTVIEAVRDAIREEMQRDSKVFVLGEDVGQRGGVFLATQGLIDEFGPSRVLDTPLAESSIMGIALGAAFRGLRPIPEVEFADFVWHTVNQLIGEAARTCYGTNGAIPVPLVVRIPYGGGIRGGLFHSQNVEIHFFHTPGLKVVAPATPFDAKGLLMSAVLGDDPTIVIEISSGDPLRVFIDGMINGGIGESTVTPSERHGYKIVRRIRDREVRNPVTAEIRRGHKLRKIARGKILH